MPRFEPLRRGLSIILKIPLHVKKEIYTLFLPLKRYLTPPNPNKNGNLRKEGARIGRLEKLMDYLARIRMAVDA